MPGLQGWLPRRRFDPDHDYVEPNEYDSDISDIEGKVTPEAGDTYIGAEVHILYGGILK